MHVLGSQAGDPDGALGVGQDEQPSGTIGDGDRAVAEEPTGQRPSLIVFGDHLANGFVVERGTSMPCAWPRLTAQLTNPRDRENGPSCPARSTRPLDRRVLRAATPGTLVTTPQA
jgi:hypothetical protein